MEHDTDLAPKIHNSPQTNAHPPYSKHLQKVVRDFEEQLDAALGLAQDNDHLYTCEYLLFRHAKTYNDFQRAISGFEKHKRHEILSEHGVGYWRRTQGGYPTKEAWQAFATETLEKICELKKPYEANIALYRKTKEAFEKNVPIWAPFQEFLRLHRDSCYALFQELKNPESGVALFSFAKHFYEKHGDTEVVKALTGNDNFEEIGKICLKTFYPFVCHDPEVRAGLQYMPVLRMFLEDKISDPSSEVAMLDGVILTTHTTIGTTWTSRGGGLPSAIPITDPTFAREKEQLLALLYQHCRSHYPSRFLKEIDNIKDILAPVCNDPKKKKRKRNKRKPALGSGNTAPSVAPPLDANLAVDAARFDAKDAARPTEHDTHTTECFNEFGHDANPSSGPKETSIALHAEGNAAPYKEAQNLEEDDAKHVNSAPSHLKAAHDSAPLSKAEKKRRKRAAKAKKSIESARYNKEKHSVLHAKEGAVDAAHDTHTVHPLLSSHDRFYVSASHRNLIVSILDKTLRPTIRYETVVSALNAIDVKVTSGPKGDFRKFILSNGRVVFLYKPARSDVGHFFLEILRKGLQEKLGLTPEHIEEKKSASPKKDPS